MNFHLYRYKNTYITLVRQSIRFLPSKRIYSDVLWFQTKQPTQNTHKEIMLWDGQQQLDKCLQCVVKGTVAIEMEHTEVDVVTTQCRAKHWETNGYAFKA